MIFGTNLSTLNIGLMMYGKATWQKAEATRKDFNTVQIRQDEKFSTSELFKVIPDAIADLEELETMDASEIYSKRLNAEEVIFPKKMENSFFQSQMDE